MEDARELKTTSVSESIPSNNKKDAMGTLYDIVFKNGEVVVGYTHHSHQDILKMILTDDIYVIQENNHPGKYTYILPKDVSHFRFDKAFSETIQPL